MATSARDWDVPCGVRIQEMTQERKDGQESKAGWR